jgi:hypothetical protein
MSDPVRAQRPTIQEALEAMIEQDRSHRGTEAGFALILAILALMLLTFLGLTLATTTSTELQIATNYRWSQQARYNAEAGIEAAKSVLRTMNWNAVLPAPRAATTWTGIVAPGVAGGGAVAPLARADEWGNPSRNFENWECDQRGNGLGYGVVLDDGAGAGPIQHRSTMFGQNLNGAFTLWVRRPTVVRGDGTLEDYALDNDTLVIVAEGIAPFTGGSAGTVFAQANQAVQLVEAVLSRASTVAAGPCGGRGGQAGGGAEGANFSPCDPITGAGLAPALDPLTTQPAGGRGDTGAQ